MFETCLNLTSTNAQRKIWSKIVPKQSGNYTIKLSWVCQGIFGISFKSILLTQPTLIWNISLGKKMTSPGLHRTKIAQGRIKPMNLLLQNFVKLCLNFRNTSLPLNYIVYVLLLNKSRVFEMLFKFVASSSRMEDLIFSKLTDSTFPKHTILI